MKIVLYLFQGTFTGNASVAYKTPTLGAQHKGILFLRQPSAEADAAQAHNVLRAYGFSTAQIERSRPIDVESLNGDMRGFAGHYDEALSKGDSLVWYP